MASSSRPCLGAVEVFGKAVSHPAAVILSVFAKDLVGWHGYTSAGSHVLENQYNAKKINNDKTEIKE